jgi:glutaredoxin
MFYVISRDDCPWCDKAVDYIENMEETVKVSLYTEHHAILLLMKQAGLKTVPQIWKDSEYIGGYTDLIERYPDAS